MGRIYVVRVEMSSPYKVEELDHPDEDTVVMKYFFNAETRRKIIGIRNRYKSKIYDNTVSFYGLQLVDDELLPKIKEIVKEADEELKKIHDGLGARMILLPISREEVEKGELYEKILYAIQYQIAKTVFERVKDLKSGLLQPKTRTSIKEMLKQMRELNILKDEKVDRMIEEIESMLYLSTNEIKSKMMEQLEYIEKLLES